MQLRYLIPLAALVAACNSPAPKPVAPDVSTEAVSKGVPLHGAAASEEMRLLRWRDENGNLPGPMALQNARREAKANADYWDMQDGGGIGRYSWTERGPSNMGGRTRALVIHPTTTSRMWAGSVGGGIWRSDNSGASWYPLDDWMGNLAIGCLAMAPTNSNVMYAGTGEGFGNFDAIAGEGIWKTTDQGSSWTKLSATSGFGSVNRIAISPVNSQIVIAATSGAIRRSVDGGTTWTTVRSGRCLQVLFDPNNSNNMVASCIDGSTHRVARSTDAGVTWTNATSGLSGTTGRIEITYAPSLSNRLYASVNVGTGEVWYSSNGGTSWFARSATGISSAQMWYNNCIWCDPTNSNNLVVGITRIFRSTDAGATFTTISNGGMNANTPHSDVHFLANDPGFNGSTNKMLYVCTDGGTWRTSDFSTATTTSGWIRRDGNYRTIQYHGVAGHGSGRLTGGTQDNGTHTINFGSLTATLTAGADGGYSAIDPTDANYIYGESQNLGLHRSTNGGASASGITSGLTDTGTCTNFIPPFILDPNNVNRLLAGGCNLWRSNNCKAATPTWAIIKSTIGSNVSAICVAPGNSNIIWVGHNNGSVYRTSNGTATSPTWTQVDNNGTTPLPNRAITRILVDRTNVNTVFVCTGGFSTNNLHRTTNNGSSWTDVTGSGATGLPSAPCNGIAQHPTLNGRYYVATEVGVFGTSDSCATWSGTNDGPADVCAIEVSFLSNSSTLLLGTHGRGMWTTSIYEPSVTSVGAGCAGSNGTPALGASEPRIGQSVSLTASNLMPNQPVWFVQGQSSTSWLSATLPFDLAPFGAPSCFLRVRADIVRDGFASASGTWSSSLPIAANTGLLGRSIYIQLFAGDFDANVWGKTTSNALRLVIGN
ncbi:MAG: hypothetical protein KDC98_26395 [Planctomycetes bacterium]|nr:hypothetical protein [Planctomycetota bacterium]